jgi:hypothetical protein
LYLHLPPFFDKIKSGYDQEQENPMTAHNTPQERQIMKSLEKMPLPAEKVSAWIERIKTEGMSEELAVEIHQALETPVEGEDPVARTRALIELARLVRQWRMGKGSKFFKK